MKNTGNKSEAATLRQRAEKLLKKKLSKTASQLSEAETLKLIHELEVHQIELELQNEELMLAKEQAIAVASEKYAELYDFAQSGYFTLSKEGKIIELNLCGSQMLGKERSHLQNSSFGFFVSSETKPIFNLFLGKVFSSKTKETCEVTLSTNYNLPTHFYLTGIVTKNGEQCFVTAIDITERKRVEKELMQSEQRYRSIIETAPDVIYTLAGDSGRITSLNPAIETITGWSRDELIGKPFEFLVHPEDLQLATETFEQVLKGEHPPAYELRILSKSGEYFIGEFKSLPHFEDEKIIGEFGFACNITDRKHTEEALKESEKKYHTLFDESLAGNFITTNEGDLQLCNPSFARMFGFDAVDDVSHLNVNSLYKNSKDRGRFLKLLREKKKLEFFEQELIRPDGKIITVLLNAVGEFDENNELVRLKGNLFDITERKQAEEALRISEEKYRNIVEWAPVGIYQTTRDGNFLSVNKRLTEILGYESIDDLQRRNIETDIYLTPSDRQSAIVRFESLGSVINHELRWKKKNGTPIWISLTAHAVKDETGITQYFEGFVTDITERKRAEEELRENEQRLSSIYDTVGDVIFHLAVEAKEKYRFISINKAFSNVTGLSQEQVVGKMVNEVIPEPSLTMVLRKYKQAINENRLIRWEENSDYPNGQLTGIVCIVPVVDDKGHCTNLVGSVHDITQRKQQEVALKESEKKYRDLFNNDLAGNFITTVDGEIRLCNPAFAHIFGFNTVEDALHFNVSRLYKTAEERKQLLKAIQEKKKLELVEKEFIRPDGKVITVLLNISGEFDKNNKLVRMIGYLLDITERKQIQEEIKKLNAELEQRVIERTAQLQAINKELETFSYSVSHDLRAPLRAIDGYTQILFEEYESKFDDEGKRLCGVIRESAQHMGKLIDDLLAFSRFNRIDMNISRIDMNELAGSIYSELTTPEMRRQIDFQLRELDSVFGDKTMLNQVWTNLISNAIKFSSQNESAVIKISCKRKKNEVVFSIQDNGVGFDMKYSDKLFGVFQRLHSAKKFEGTGVGLAIVQRIINRHGGEVWAEGEVNKGASFYFSLPM